MSLNCGRGCVGIPLSGISGWTSHWHTNREWENGEGYVVCEHVLRKESSESMAVL